MLTMIADLNRSRAGRRFLIWGGIATLALIGIVFAIRFDQFDFNFEDLELDSGPFESDILGSAMQQLFVPLVGIFLLSTTPYFQKLVTGKPLSDREKIAVALLLLGILTLNLFVTIWQNDEFFLGVTDGLLLVLISALLLGGLAGLSSALFVVVFYSMNAMALEGAFEGLEPLIWTIIDLELLAVVWAGIVIGLWRDAQDQIQFNPYRLFVLGFLIEWLSAWLELVGYGEFVLLDQLPGAIVSGLSLMVLGLLTQQVLGREAEKRLVVSEQVRAQAELKALRAQINPHFLFNALSTIKYHARTHPETAYDLLDDLSDVFHTALRSDPFVRLEEELDMIQSYLAIEQARLRERLTVSFEVEDAVDLNVQVPALILQPIVENSVIHGIAPKEAGGCISIRVSQHDNVCRIEIEDNGLGFDTTNPQTKGSGIGLTNSSERLVALYGEEYRPQVESTNGRGTTVTIAVPALK